MVKNIKFKNKAECQQLLERFVCIKENCGRIIFVDYPSAL